MSYREFVETSRVQQAGFIYCKLTIYSEALVRVEYTI